MSSSHGIGAPSSSKRRVPGVSSSEASASEEMQNRSNQVHHKHYDDTYSAPYSADYHHEPRYHHEQQHHVNPPSFQYQDSAPNKKKRYTGNIVEHTDAHQQGSRSEYNQYYYNGEGKENLPSFPMYSHDARYHHAYPQALGYEQCAPHDGSSYLVADHQHSYPNEKEWHQQMHHDESYYHHGPPQLYHPGSGGVESVRVYDENGSHPSSTRRDCRGYSFVDHTYRDFSGVPPTEEDRERYNNKKKEYERRMKEHKANSKNETDNTKEEEVPSRALKKRRGRGNRAAKNGSSFVGFMGTNFPARLHDLLSHEEEISDIITWLPHGRSWIVLDKVEFLKKVAPSHFQISKFESFTRQVNGWGFKRITQGPDINSYYHELFLRAMPHLIQWMKRSTSTGSGRRKIRGDPKDEPDFYSISQMYPLPNYYGENEVKTARASCYADNSSKNEDGSGTNKNDDFDQYETIPSPIRIKRHLNPVQSKKNENNKSILTSNSNYHQYHHDQSFPLSSHLVVHNTNKEFVDDHGTIGPYDGDAVAGNEYANRGYQADVPPPHGTNDGATHVKTSWKRNDSDTIDPYYHQTYPPHQRPTSIHQFPHHHEKTYHRHEDYDGRHHHVDFKPSEGTVGNLETFCWDDADYVREKNDYSRSNSDSNGDHREHKTLDNGYPASCSAIVSKDDVDDIHFLHSATDQVEDTGKIQQQDIVSPTAKMMKAATRSTDITFGAEQQESSRESGENNNVERPKNVTGSDDDPAMIARSHYSPLMKNPRLPMQEEEPAGIDIGNDEIFQGNKGFANDLPEPTLWAFI